MKPICSALGVACSHVAQLLVRPADWIDGRTTQMFHQPADTILVDGVRVKITVLSTYGYRRADSLVNRTRALMGLRAINHNQFYRVTKANSLLPTSLNHLPHCLSLTFQGIALCTHQFPPRHKS